MAPIIGTAAGRDAKAFLSSAGSWRGLVDAEGLIRDIYADRLVATREAARPTV